MTCNYTDLLTMMHHRAFNLSTHYFDPEFSRQLRAHSFTPKITALLKDCLQHPVSVHCPCIYTSSAQCHRSSQMQLDDIIVEQL